MKRPENIGCIVATIIGFILAIAILFPALPSDPEGRPKTHVKNDEVQLVTAIRAFYTEYGRLPKTSAECIPVDGKLMSILIGSEHQENPRKIVFIEVQPASKKRGLWRSGIHPKSGAWLDAYGNPYLVKFATDYNGSIPNPYTDNFAGERKIHSLVIAWSAGKDGIFGNLQRRGELKGSDDIVSWR